MRTWLARLSYSFLIIAGFLAWEAWQGMAGHLAISQARITLYLIAAVMALALGFTGIRQRHRQD